MSMSDKDYFRFAASILAAKAGTGSFVRLTPTLVAFLRQMDPGTAPFLDRIQAAQKVVNQATEDLQQYFLNRTTQK